jgi:hypothetical protein
MSEVSAGTPYLANPEYPFLDIAWLVSKIIPYPPYNINVTIALYLFMSMLGTFLLVNHITKNHKAAFIAGISIPTSGFFICMLGQLPFTNPMAFVPFALLFIFKALEENSFVKNSIFSSIFIAYMVLSGGISNFMWFMLLIPILIIILRFIFFGINDKTIFRIVAVFLIILVFVVGFTAIKFLPGLEYIEKGGSRNMKLRYIEFIGSSPISNLMNSSFFLNFTLKNTFARIGIVSLLIIIAGLFFLKRKKNFYLSFSLAGLLLIFLIASGSFINRFFYMLPYIGALRNVSNVLFLMPFLIAILLGIGFNSLQKRFPFLSKKYMIVIIIILLIAELLFVFPFYRQSRDINSDVKNSEMMHKLDELFKQEELFRIHALQEQMVSSGLCTRIIYNPSIHVSNWCSGNAWDNHDIIFDYISKYTEDNAPNEEMPKYFAQNRGIINDKYIISPRKIYGIDKKPLPYLTLIGNYSDVKGAYGYSTYLYENEKFLPRFYFIDKAVLLYGNLVSSVKLYHYNMLNDDLFDYFDPSKAVILFGDQITTEVAEVFELIVISDRNEQDNSIKLIAENDPKKIFPSSYYDDVSIQERFAEINATLLPIEVELYTPNKIILTLPENAKQGFVVMSEPFVRFDGWNVKIAGKKQELLNAYNIITAFYINNPGLRTIEMSYLPTPFIVGSIITLVTIILSIIIIKKIKKK